MLHDDDDDRVCVCEKDTKNNTKKQFFFRKVFLV